MKNNIVDVMHDRCSKEDASVIDLIADRIVKLLPGKYITDIQMDLMCLHTHGCPLDLLKLLNFKNNEVLHDYAGIRRNLNRDTGELENEFYPKSAVKTEASAGLSEMNKARWRTFLGELKP